MNATADAVASNTLMDSGRPAMNAQICKRKNWYQSIAFQSILEKNMTGVALRTTADIRLRPAATRLSISAP
jgi:hypothetical protein